MEERKVGHKFKISGLGEPMSDGNIVMNKK
jgi:hypothetical protein